MVGHGNGWGVWEDSRAWLCAGPGVDAAHSIYTDEPEGFTQSVNIYWASTLCLERCWGFERNVQIPSLFGGDTIIQTDPEQKNKAGACRLVLGR